MCVRVEKAIQTNKTPINTRMIVKRFIINFFNDNTEIEYVYKNNIIIVCNLSKALLLKPVKHDIFINILMT